MHHLQFCLQLPCCCTRRKPLPVHLLTQDFTDLCGSPYSLFSNTLDLLSQDFVQVTFNNFLALSALITDLVASVVWCPWRRSILPTVGLPDVTTLLHDKKQGCILLRVFCSVHYFSDVNELLKHNSTLLHIISAWFLTLRAKKIINQYCLNISEAHLISNLKCLIVFL